MSRASRRRGSGWSGKAASTPEAPPGGASQEAGHAEETGGRGPNRPEWTTAAAALLIAAFAAHLVLTATHTTAVCDELGAHIPAGVLFWESGEFSGGIANVPLGQLLIALPVHLLGVDYELFTEQHLLLFRLPVIAMALLTALLVFRLGVARWGARAGLLAVAVVALSPNLTAHGALATLDLPATFAILLTVFALDRYATRPTIPRMIAVSVALGAALLVKIQAVLLIPWLAAAAPLLVLRPGDPDPPDRLRVAASWLLAPVVVVVVLHLGYLQLPFSGGSLLPAPFVEAIRVKLAHGASGHFAYLMGSYSTDGWWFYFPLAVLLKTPLPMLALAAVGAARRPDRQVALLVLAPAVLFLSAGIAGRINIGLRHVLPIYPFLALLAGAGADRVLRWRWGRPVLAVAVAWQLAAVVHVFPSSLSSFNLLAGGPSNGHRFLIDSNYDWGQNDDALRRHVARTGSDVQIDPDPFRPTGGRVLVNANAYYGLLNGGPEAYRYLKDREPVDRIAFTWFEFDLGEAPDAAPDPLPELRRVVGGFLVAVRRAADDVDDPRFRLALARAFADAALYQPAFEEIRGVLARDPAHEPALGLGGELVVRHKLGVLRYRGTEYLDGFPEAPPPAAGDLDRVVATARRDGVPESVSTALTALGFARFSSGQPGPAAEAFRLALAFDPANDTARANLQQLLRSP